MLLVVVINMVTSTLRLDKVPYLPNYRNLISLPNPNFDGIKFKKTFSGFYLEIDTLYSPLISLKKFATFTGESTNEFEPYVPTAFTNRTFRRIKQIFPRLNKMTQQTKMLPPTRLTFFKF